MRTLHRWLGLAFLLAVILNVVALAQQQQSVLVGLIALFPLGLLMISGLCLFFWPYFSRAMRERKTGQRNEGQNRAGV